MAVTMRFRKWRSWETRTTVSSNSERKSSSQRSDSGSRWLVGSSSSRIGPAQQEPRERGAHPPAPREVSRGRWSSSVLKPSPNRITLASARAGGRRAPRSDAGARRAFRPAQGPRPGGPSGRRPLELRFEAPDAVEARERLGQGGQRGGRGDVLRQVADGDPAVDVHLTGVRLLDALPGSGTAWSSPPRSARPGRCAPRARCARRDRAGSPGRRTPCRCARARSRAPATPWSGRGPA